MKLCLLTLLICFALFSYCCSPNTPAHYVLASASGEKFTGINTEYLCQHWVNSYEEEPQTNKGHLYRPKHFKEFPASRFRMQYIFYRDGTCKWFYLDPTDGHHFKPGNWRVGPNNRNVLQIIQGGITDSYRVSELKKDVLRMSFVGRK